MYADRFIEKAKLIHGNKYDYSNSVYTRSTDKVEIICLIHGSFWQTPHKHTQGCGCQKCGLETIKKKSTGSIEAFLKKSKDVHGTKYGYDKVVYISAKQNVTITCPIHGNFEQTPDSHTRGCGCTSCANEKTAKRMTGNRRISIVEFIKRANILHDNKYKYSAVTFEKTQEKVMIECPEHGIFKLTVNKHLLGKECPKCTMHGRVQNGWKTSTWEIAGSKSKNFIAYSVYVIKCKNDTEEFYKIGKTFRSMSDRIGKIKEAGYSVEVIQHTIGTALDMSKKEKSMHRQNINTKYVPTVKFCGCQECYTEVIL